MEDHFFKYFKVMVENNIISKNKWLIMWFLVGGSAAGNATQFITDKSGDLIMARQQITNIAKLYHKHYTDNCK